MTQDPKPFWESELYAFLSDRFPTIKNERGLFHVYRFASLVDVSAETVYKWIRNNRVPARGASRIVHASEGRVTSEDLLRFVIV